MISNNERPNLSINFQSISTLIQSTSSVTDSSYPINTIVK